MTATRILSKLVGESTNLNEDIAQLKDTIASAQFSLNDAQETLYETQVAALAIYNNTSNSVIKRSYEVVDGSVVPVVVAEEEETECISD